MHPWDIDRLTEAEVQVYREALAAELKQMEQAKQKAAQQQRGR